MGQKVMQSSIVLRMFAYIRHTGENLQPFVPFSTGHKSIKATYFNKN